MPCYSGAETREEDASAPRESPRQKERSSRPWSTCTWPAGGSCRLSSRTLKSTGSSLRSSRWQPVRWSGACWRSGNPRCAWGQEPPSHHPSSLQSQLQGGLEPSFPLPSLLRGRSELTFSPLPFLLRERSELTFSPLPFLLQEQSEHTSLTFPSPLRGGSERPFSPLPCPLREAPGPICFPPPSLPPKTRTEERRVGKEWLPS